MSRPGGALLVAAAGLTALVTVTGCGAGPQGGPRAAVSAFKAAWSRQDGLAVCRLLAPQTRTEVAKSAGKPCPRAVLEESLPAAAPVRSARVWGRSAQVRTGDDTMFIAEFAGGWRVVAAGCRPQPGKPYDCQVQGG